MTQNCVGTRRKYWMQVYFHPFKDEQTAKTHSLVGPEYLWFLPLCFMTLITEKG